MAVIFIRTTIIFITLIVIMRLMGKRQIGEMQPFEFVITLIIADLACIPMADVSIPLVYGIIAILALFILHQFMFLVEKMGNLAKKVISGKPSIIINKNGIDFKELRKNNIDIEDLLQAIRSQGYFSFDAVAYAIFESNGKFSILEKSDYDNTKESIPLVVIAEGKLYNNVLIRKDLPLNLINGFLEKVGCSVKKVDILTLDPYGRVYFQQKDKPYETYTIKLPESVEKW